MPPPTYHSGGLLMVGGPHFSSKKSLKMSVPPALTKDQSCPVSLSCIFEIVAFMESNGGPLDMSVGLVTTYTMFFSARLQLN